jgi:hypothetical protein
MDVINDTTPDFQAFEPTPGEKKKFASLSELTRIVKRIEDSCTEEVLSKFPDMRIEEVALLIERYYPASFRNHEVEASELSLLLQTIFREFQEEEQINQSREQSYQSQSSCNG